MEIVKLPAGRSAPSNVDCIRIQELPDGTFNLEGGVLLCCGDADGTESVSLVGGTPYPSYDDAERAGMAWANEHCVEVLHIARSDGTASLPDVVE